MAEDRHQIDVRHQLFIDQDTGLCVVKEFFGPAPIDVENVRHLMWEQLTEGAARLLIKERRALVLKMVASLSDDAAEAVGKAVMVDMTRAGHG